MNVLAHHREEAVAAPKRREDGMATLVYIVLLAIMMVLLMTNVRTIVRLQRELKLVDQKQVHRLDPGQTNMIQGARP